MLRFPPADNRKMQHHRARIALETPGHRITGTVTLSRDGYRSRLSDLLNAPEQAFLSLIDATVEPLDGQGDTTHHDFIAVHCQHVVFALALGTVEPVPVGPSGLVA